MDDGDAWARLAAARVARLATTTPDGAPHVVPITFAVVGETIAHAIDHKPKSTRALARVRNLRADPRASALVDRYDDDWDALWWVRADGRAEILEVDDAEASDLIDALVAKYEQYRGGRRPQGPVIALRVERVSGWEAAARTGRARPSD
jgi:PPOX class probable F420-dependent enzyme